MTRQLPTTAVCIVTTGLVVDNYDMNVYAIIYTAERKSGREREGEREKREREAIVYRCCCVISCFCLVQLVSGQTEPGRCVHTQPFMHT